MNKSPAEFYFQDRARAEIDFIGIVQYYFEVHSFLLITYTSTWIFGFSLRPVLKWPACMPSALDLPPPSWL
jgi:hypothetical protein